ncbi:MAG: transposase [Thermoplasmata archaeon]|nr:transposase [Thermoplasmata archaeon]
MDRPVRRREFRVSSLAVLLLFKILFNLSYRTIASANKDLGMYKALGMKRAPCYKTIQNTMRHLTARGLERVSRRLPPESTELASVDASGMKTTRRGAWVIVRFRRRERWRDFKKVHIFVDLVSKKIIHCLVTKGTSSDHPQLRRILRRCRWSVITSRACSRIPSFLAMLSIRFLRHRAMSSRAKALRRYLGTNIM